MTQPEERPETKPEAVSDQTEQSGQTPVSDDQEQDNGKGTHGRPSDDSDPGHS